MITEKFQTQLGHHTLFVDLKNEVERRTSRAPAGTLLFVGVKSVERQWKDITPFLFKPEDLGAALACMEEWIPRLRGSRFLPACWHECVVYYLDAQNFNLFIETKFDYECVNDEAFTTMVTSMMTWQPK